MPSSPFTEEEKKYFPLKNIQSVVKLFEHHLARSHDDPNLSLLSIIVGAIENTLTFNNKTTAASSSTSSNHSESGSITISSTCLIDEADDFPPLDIHVVEALHAKFKAIIKSSVDLPFYNCKKGDYATRELIKRVSDVIWNTLTRSYYKDRAHLQSLYSYLTGNKLDCFGVAFAVIAGCQILGFKDVHLALSEDHAWVVFGEHGQETAEVTWHGKGSEDKRGACIDAGLSANSWLYVAGHPVIGLAKGGRFTQVAALVSSINPSVSLSVDSMEVAGLQQALLWLLYDMGYLDNYPMALGNLADLEEIAPASGRLSCQYLFQQAIQVSRRMYNNCHVYPYTYQGGYYYRNRLYKEALDSWANAADVVRNYNYSREDEEIYKEFLEIANELIPHIMKVEGSGHNARSILKDPQCFAHLLRFYDGICQWEEGSSTPVLHIGWAKPLVNTISKFDADVRAQVHIIEEQEAVSEPSHESGNRSFVDEELLLDTNSNILESQIKSPCKSALRDYFARIEDKVDTRPSSVSNATLAALTELCGQTVLNATYFMGGKLVSENESNGGVLALAEDFCDLEKSPKTVESDFVGPSAAGNPNLVLLKTEAPPTRPSNEPKEALEPNSEESVPTFPVHPEGGQKEGPKLVLNSQKMRGLKDLLLSEKLNTHAISLQLTAQSQVQLGRKGRGGGAEDGSVATPPPKDEKHVGASRPKRSRRE